MCYITRRGTIGLVIRLRGGKKVNIEIPSHCARCGDAVRSERQKPIGEGGTGVP